MAEQSGAGDSVSRASKFDVNRSLWQDAFEIGLVAGSCAAHVVLILAAVRVLQVYGLPF